MASRFIFHNSSTQGVYSVASTLWQKNVMKKGQKNVKIGGSNAKKREKNVIEKYVSK